MESKTIIDELIEWLEEKEHLWHDEYNHDYVIKNENTNELVSLGKLIAVEETLEKIGRLRGTFKRNNYYPQEDDKKEV